MLLFINQLIFHERVNDTRDLLVRQHLVEVIKSSGPFPILFFNLIVLICLPYSRNALIKDHHKLAIGLPDVLAELHVHVASYSCAGDVSNPVHPVTHIKDYYFYTLFIGVIFIWRGSILRECHDKVTKEKQPLEGNCQQIDIHKSVIWLQFIS